ncbi:hypothetical protein T265_06414 [Opisthorchis viverrini]|uniref:Transcription elongation factor 1 homolog n=3 Tax=Opisthorchis TaxID=6197 RepID=A0A074ZG85_OPIVI|nr:hypothetical protein T265_06414 [Opisthorchis viverrini]KER26296.1 hypothetical protein T265_06414 [Opisthorchis viverrini]
MRCSRERIGAICSCFVTNGIEGFIQQLKLTNPIQAQEIKACVVREVASAIELNPLERYGTVQLPGQFEASTRCITNDALCGFHWWPSNYVPVAGSEYLHRVTSHKDETLELILGHGAELKALAFSVDHTGICDEILSIPFGNLETLITNIEQGTLLTEYLGQNFDSICETKVTREFGEYEICEPIVFSCPQFPQQQSNFPCIVKLNKVGLKHVFIFLEPAFESSSRFSIEIKFSNRAGSSICGRRRRLKRFCRVHRHTAHQIFNKPHLSFFELLSTHRLTFSASYAILFVNFCEMGRRRSANKPPPKRKAIQPLDKVFNCPFCNHGRSCEVVLQRDNNIGYIKCTICLEDFQTKINYLSQEIDVYNDWIDACEEANA